MGKVLNVLWLLLTVFAANCWLAVTENLWCLLPAVGGFLAANVLAGAFDRSLPERWMRICRHGQACLRLFLFSTVVSVGYHAVMAFYLLPGRKWDWIISAAVCVCVEAVVFWNGIISIYCTSRQIGIKYRVIGVVCGLIPVANLVVLGLLLQIVRIELDLEREKHRINMLRQEEQVCRTKYPLLLVHGVFFRDFKYFNYWGRIPAELERNGATVYYGEHQSAAAVADSARELTNRIRHIVETTGCEKVNIIAHSKGGLDCRYAIAHLGAAPYVASLTTVNTPHRGCMFADHLLWKIPENIKNKVAQTYNAVLRKLGDPAPDFMAAVTDLTAWGCREFDALPTPEGIYCQSVGSVMKYARTGKFPMNLSYHLAKKFDGPNDGLVAESAFCWGQDYTLVTTEGKRGISHGDMIDLNRENICDFDVREFYVGLVSRLRLRGL